MKHEREVQLDASEETKSTRTTETKKCLEISLATETNEDYVILNKLSKT